MQSDSSQNHERSRLDGGGLTLPLPVRDGSLFKHSATAYILNFLSDNPDINVSIRQLSRVTPHSERATREAVDVLEANDLIEAFHKGNARRVHINRSLLHRPTDPIRSIPQPEFHTPVRVAQQYIEDELEDVLGIVLFGSVARGDADRRSDIDLWVLVGGDQLQQRHAANELSNHLESLRIPPSVAVTDALNADFEREWEQIKETLERDAQSQSSAQRHSFELIVETQQSIINQAASVDAEELFGTGITLRSSDTLERVKLEVLDHE